MTFLSSHEEPGKRRLRGGMRDPLKIMAAVDDDSYVDDGHQASDWLC